MGCEEILEEVGEKVFQGVKNPISHFGQHPKIQDYAKNCHVSEKSACDFPTALEIMRQLINKGEVSCSQRDIFLRSIFGNSDFLYLDYL